MPGTLRFLVSERILILEKSSIRYSFRVRAIFYSFSNAATYFLFLFFQPPALSTEYYFFTGALIFWQTSAWLHLRSTITYAFRFHGMSDISVTVPILGWSLNTIIVVSVFLFPEWISVPAIERLAMIAIPTALPFSLYKMDRGLISKVR